MNCNFIVGMYSILATVNMDIGSLQEELDRQKEENRMQHEQILTLQAKLTDSEMRLHKVRHLLNERHELSAVGHFPISSICNIQANIVY